MQPNMYHSLSIANGTGLQYMTRSDIARAMRLLRDSCFISFSCFKRSLCSVSTLFRAASTSFCHSRISSISSEATSSAGRPVVVSVIFGNIRNIYIVLPGILCVSTEQPGVGRKRYRLSYSIKNLNETVQDFAGKYYLSTYLTPSRTLP